MTAPEGLLALDLDGTIVNPDTALNFTQEKKIVDGFLPELEVWRQAGWKIAVITARARAPLFIEPLHPDAVTQMYGCLIRIGETQTRRLTLTSSAVQQALGLLHAPELDFGVSKTMVVGADARQGWWNGPNNMIADYCEVADVIKVYHQQRDTNRIDELQRLWSELPGVHVIREDDFTLVLVAEAGDKGEALKFIAGHFGVPFDRVVAVGDGNSDAAMLAVAGQFIRVGQNPLLVGASHHAPTPEELPALLTRFRQDAKWGFGTRNG